MNLPLVSVCIPTFNGEKFLVQALDSVKSQTYDNIEVIISDDSSCDRTLDISKKFKDKFDNPVFIFTHQPGGIGANWNYCLKMANGEYIKFLFQDDILYPDCIEKLVDLLENNKTLGLVSCKRKFILEEPATEEIIKWMRKYGNLQADFEITDNKITIITKDLFKTKSFFKSPLNKIGEPSAVLFKSSILKDVGYFREDLVQILDYEFYYRVLKKTNIGVLNEKLVNFRIHSSQATNVNRYRKIQDYDKFDKILYVEFFWYLSMKEKKRLLLKYCKTYRLGKRILDAAKRKF